MRQIVRRAARLVIATVGVVAIGSVGISGAGAATDPAEWGEVFCVETTTWLDGAQAGAEDLAANADVSPKKGRALLVDFFATGVSATKAYGKRIRAAGAPDAAQGAEIQRALLAGIKGVQKRLARLEKQAKKLPTGNTAKFQQKSTDLGLAFQGVLEPWSSALDEIDRLDPDQALIAELRPIPACDFLAGTAAESAG
jgi:hypothetical protein